MMRQYCILSSQEYCLSHLTISHLATEQKHHPHQESRFILVEAYGQWNEGWFSYKQQTHWHMALHIISATIHYGRCASVQPNMDRL